MVKLTTKEDVALLVEEASEMFEETGCVPDVDGKKVRAEKIVPRAKRYILETIDNPKSRYDATIWHSPGYTLVLSWLSQKWLKYCQKLAPTVLKDVDLHLPKDQRKLCLDWAADELTRNKSPGGDSGFTKASTTMSKPVRRGLCGRCPITTARSSSDTSPD
jgi:hypothetical protein